MMRSTKSTALSRHAVASCPPERRFTQSVSQPFCDSTLRIIATTTMLVSCASEPPLRMQALPAFMHSENTSKVTLGRASYTIPITPKGTVTLSMRNPLGRSTLISVIPSGDGRAATALMSATMSRSLSSVRRRRSRLGFSGSMRSMSERFASRIAGILFSASSATAFIMRDISSSVRRASLRDAVRAA